MGHKHHRPEEIVGKLRQVEVLTVQGKPVIEAVRVWTRSQNDLS